MKKQNKLLILQFAEVPLFISGMYTTLTKCSHNLKPLSISRANI